MLESEIQTQCIDFLKRHNITHWRVALGGVRHGGVRKANPMKGMPDICGVLRQSTPGRFFGIELKTKTGKLSKDQSHWLKILKESGAAVEVIRDVHDLEVFMRGCGEIP